MNDRLEIASRILAAWFTEDSHEDYNEAAVCKSALCWADALIAAELATRPKPAPCEHKDKRSRPVDYLGGGQMEWRTWCADCGAEVPDARMCQEGFMNEDALDAAIGSLRRRHRRGRGEG